MKTNVPIKRWATALAVLATLLSGVAVQAQESKPTPAAPSAPKTEAQPAAAPAAPTAVSTNQPATGYQKFAKQMDDFVHQSKNPAPWWKWGADLRLRNEYFDNGVTFNQDAVRSEQDYLRFRARWWNTFTVVTNLDLNVRLTAEPREYLKPNPGGTLTGWDWTEGIIDNLNVKWSKALDLPATLTVGRQDITLGEPGNWWLVVDGTPGDGSRTFYFDATRLTYEVKECKTTIDAIYIDQAARNDRWLPPINYLKKYQIEQDERGVILYLSNKSLPSTTVDAYFMYKNDNQVPGQLKGDDADIYTLGSRISGLVVEHVKYYAEGAYQLGEKKVGAGNLQDIQAFGVNSRLSYLLKDPLNNQGRVSYEFLSGNDPNSTGRDEQFDLLWGRWPRWSEVYNIYGYVQETRVGQTANLHRVGPGWGITPMKKMDLTADYYLLFADEKNPNRPAIIDRNGTFRGQFVQAILKYKFNDHFSGHLWSETMWPGDYYLHSDIVQWFRAEILITY